jgi:hypothetical protein
MTVAYAQSTKVDEAVPAGIELLGEEPIPRSKGYQIVSRRNILPLMRLAKRFANVLFR